MEESAAKGGILDGLKVVAQNGEAKDRAERLAVGQAPVVFDTADSPACTDCGSIMVRNGSCYKCINCGATSGSLMTESARDTTEFGVALWVRIDVSGLEGDHDEQQRDRMRQLVTKCLSDMDFGRRLRACLEGSGWAAGLVIRGTNYGIESVQVEVEDVQHPRDRKQG